MKRKHLLIPFVLGLGIGVALLGVLSRWQSPVIAREVTEPEVLLVGQVRWSPFVSFDDVTLTVRFDGPANETVVDVDANGLFTVTSDDLTLEPVTYTVCIKEMRTCAYCYDEPVMIPTTEPPVNFGLVAGDANDDATINMIDFGVWMGIFNGGFPVYDKRGDFNNDGIINMIDFSVWAGVFGAG